jgi:hypothetical protein
MISSLQLLKYVLPGSKLIIAQAPPTTQDFARYLKTHWGYRQEADIGNGLKLRFRTIGKLVATGDYTLKFVYVTENVEVPDLEFVLYVSYDQDMGTLYARKLRAISKEKEYRNTAPDEREVICFEPAEIVTALREKFHDRTSDLNRVAHRLYTNAMAHIGERHPELNRDIEQPDPFDFAQEMMRYLNTKPAIKIANRATLTPLTAGRMKEGTDVVIKFTVEADDLPNDLLLNFYVTTDADFGAVAIRKIRLLHRATDYSDSDKDHTLTLQGNARQSAQELYEQLEDGEFGRVVNGMLLTALPYFATRDDEV